ncbi:WD40 repeat-like protein [Ceratobasidium sp. AG-Ba]|nr:WD40 repeat-like protein [Ceratobasidium sp. AG-Ba]
MNIFKTFETLIGGASPVAISPRGDVAAVGDLKNITIWDVHTGTKHSKPLAESARVLSLAFSHDSQRLVSGLNDGTLSIWDVASREPVISPLKVHICLISCLSFSHDGELVVSGSYDRTFGIWDASTGKQKYGPVPMGNTVLSIAISPGKDRVVCGLIDGAIKTYDLDTKYLGIKFFHHRGPVFSTLFSQDGTRIASAGYGQEVCLRVGKDYILRDVFNDTGTQAGESSTI